MLCFRLAMHLSVGDSTLRRNDLAEIRLPRHLATVRPCVSKRRLDMGDAAAHASSCYELLVRYETRET